MCNSNHDLYVVPRNEVKIIFMKSLESLLLGRCVQPPKNVVYFVTMTFLLFSLSLNVVGSPSLCSVRIDVVLGSAAIRK